MDKHNIVFVKAREVVYPNAESKYRPSVLYPEYIYPKDMSLSANVVYDAVREAFHLLKMDEKNYGKKEWNPLGELIHPGDHVLLKPNLVMDYNLSNQGTECLYTQPGVVAAVLDYVILALDGTGKITIGDAPMQECQFDKLIEESGYKELLQFYHEKGIDIELVDFRELTTQIVNGVRHQTIHPNSRGTVIDLGEESEFAIYDAEHLRNMRITNYDPTRLNSHHQVGKHEYYVSDYVLDADVVINMPKPKTHRKAGVTIALKNLVGINVRKEYLPHHTVGPEKSGGDEYRVASSLKIISGKLYDKKNYYEGHEKYRLAMVCRLFGGGLKVLASLIHGDATEGNWYGNQTISKTIVDLNKILLYADKNGELQESKQRELFNVADMIISGEKEGPVAPSPKEVGFIVAGKNAVNFDKTVATMMGADITRLPVLQNADHMHGKLQIKDMIEPLICSNVTELDGKCCDELTAKEKWCFVSTSGWKEIFESKTDGK